MSINLKILGMALLALLATSAFAVINASANQKPGEHGHFTHEGATNNAIITGHEAKGTEHQLKFYRLDPSDHTKTASGNPIECATGSYEGTVAAKTVESITLTPKYTNCQTEGGAENEVSVPVNGCGYTFFSHAANTHGTVEVHCPAGKAIEIIHPNCTTTIPAQTTASTLTGGITYTTATEKVGGVDVHTLTANVTVGTITGHFHAGICIFLGTSQKFEMKGSVTVRGYNDVIVNEKPTEGAQIGITHT